MQVLEIAAAELEIGDALVSILESGEEFYSYRIERVQHRIIAKLVRFWDVRGKEFQVPAYEPTLIVRGKGIHPRGGKVKEQGV